MKCVWMVAGSTAASLFNQKRVLEVASDVYVPSSPSLCVMGLVVDKNSNCVFHCCVLYTIFNDTDFHHVTFV